MKQAISAAPSLRRPGDSHDLPHLLKLMESAMDSRRFSFIELPERVHRILPRRIRRRIPAQSGTFPRFPAITT